MRNHNQCTKCLAGELQVVSSKRIAKGPFRAEKVRCPNCGRELDRVTMREPRRKKSPAAEA